MCIADVLVTGWEHALPFGHTKHIIDSGFVGLLEAYTPTHDDLMLKVLCAVLIRSAIDFGSF